MDFIKASYRKMLKIRLVEQKILFLYSQNKISGTTHTYIGQEAIAVAAMNHICEGILCSVITDAMGTILHMAAT